MKNQINNYWLSLDENRLIYETGSPEKAGGSAEKGDEKKTGKNVKGSAEKGAGSKETGKKDGLEWKMKFTADMSKINQGIEKEQQDQQTEQAYNRWRQYLNKPKSGYKDKNILNDESTDTYIPHDMPNPLKQHEGPNVNEAFDIPETRERLIPPETVKLMEIAQEAIYKQYLDSAFIWYMGHEPEKLARFDKTVEMAVKYPHELDYRLADPGYIEITKHKGSKVPDYELSDNINIVVDTGSSNRTDIKRGKGMVIKFNGEDLTLNGSGGSPWPTKDSYKNEFLDIYTEVGNTLDDEIEAGGKFDALFKKITGKYPEFANTFNADDKEIKKCRNLNEVINKLIERYPEFANTLDEKTEDTGDFNETAREIIDQYLHKIVKKMAERDPKYVGYFETSALKLPKRIKSLIDLRNNSGDFNAAKNNNNEYSIFINCVKYQPTTIQELIQQKNWYMEPAFSAKGLYREQIQFKMVDTNGNDVYAFFSDEGYILTKNAYTGNYELADEYYNSNNLPLEKRDKKKVQQLIDTLKEKLARELNPVKKAQISNDISKLEQYAGVRFPASDTVIGQKGIASPALETVSFEPTPVQKNYYENKIAELGRRIQ
jgi:hypothetical protein